MAEAYYQALIENVNSLMRSEVGLIMGVDEEMKNLSNTLTTIQKVLEDTDDRQLQEEPILDWLSQLNDMAFEIEDLLDDCNTQFAKLQGGRVKFLKKVVFKRKVGKRMKEAAEKLESVANGRHNFQLKKIVVQEPDQLDRRRETVSILSDWDQVYGREEERVEILEMLFRHFSALTVLPIVGPKGMGKTTLAQLIYNSQIVVEHFDIRIWVCVSDHYDFKVVLKAIIESATGDRSNFENLGSLRIQLFQLLYARRYLLILDDVWIDNPEDWHELKSCLPDNSNCSRIVVTTRLQKVADMMGTLPAHHLNQLSEEHCWLLFRAIAFGPDNEQPHANLEAIGRRIVKKCLGVPQAAKVLGGLLRFKRDENEWIRMEESNVLDLPEEDTIWPLLRLSYGHLSMISKRCFVYCAVFPKDHEFVKTEIIFHWMAHGCIPSNGTEEVEDVGDQICNELTTLSFFQVVDTRGGETIFQLHGLLHDLAQSIMEHKIPGAKTESSRTSALNSKIREVRCGSKINHNSSIAVEVSKLSYIIKYNNLRTLKLCWATVKELPSAIGKLKELRCFTLIVSSIRTLPRTFCRLSKLQILVLRDCFELESLPKDIRLMTNLRHIILEGCGKLTSPYRIGELTSLKTLSLFIAGDKKGNQLDELEHLDLRGRLEIKNLESVRDLTIAKKASLDKKLNLRDLVLRWNGDNKLMDDEQVLEALEPHPNLVSLEIDGA